MLCPEIAASPYYQAIYDAMKADFGTLPHAIFGRQSQPVDDAAVLPYLSEADLFAMYAAAPVMVYPSAEPRHVHYSPVEAMIVGTPVLYRRGALLDRLAGTTLPGACVDADELRAKAGRLLGRRPRSSDADQGDPAGDRRHVRDRARRPAVGLGPGAT